MSKENILFLVHVQETFRGHFPSMYVPRLIKACRAGKYDKVIFLNSDIDDPGPILEIMQCSMEHMEYITWSWGYDHEQFKDQPDELPWVVPTSSPHQWTWVPPEVRSMNLQHCNVFVGGGCRWECMQDFLDVLHHLNVKHEIVDGYVYGN